MKRVSITPISSIQRATAYVLLAGQLLSSCGVPKETIAPVPLTSHTTADLPSATPHEATPAPAFPISTTTVDGKEVVFDYKGRCCANIIIIASPSF